MPKLALATLAAAALALSAPAPAVGAGSWTWPLRGEVITPYRNGADPYAAGQHRGVDIAGRVGAPVVAATGGSVRFVGSVGWSGLTVTVRTADGRFDTSYLHLSAASVRAGESVGAGQRLGSVGTSGRRSAEQPHLHFSVRDAGARQAYHDPLDFLAPLATPRPAPRGAPVPVGRPLLRHPAPLRPAPGPLPASHARKVRVPAGRRVRAPRPAPRARPARWPAGVPSASPVPVGAPERHPSPASRPASRPGLGVAPGPQPRPGEIPRAERPAQAPRRSPDRGLDVGLALACAGALLAAAFMGGTGEGRARATRSRARLAALLAPLTGRG
jgi:murein DD-endopeptidase MepM/ murein hydrolase activator NlpD